MQALTIDFHNTLFRCDDWFELEIASLPVAYLRHSGQIDDTVDSIDLVNHVATRYRALRKTVIDTGQECDAITSVIQVLDEVGIERSVGHVERGVRQIMFAALAQAMPLPGAVELVNQAHQAGVRLAIVSSACYHPFLEWCLEKYGIRARFNAVISSAACGIYKSDPGIYQHALQALGAVPERSVHVGDSHQYDVRSASRIGMRTVLLSDDHDQQLRPDPDLVISSLHRAFPRMACLFDAISVT